LPLAIETVSPRICLGKQVVPFSPPNFSRV
jgi:hypothetical protein